MELLLWDVWEVVETEPTAEDLRLLDRVAEFTQAGDAEFPSCGRFTDVKRLSKCLRWW